MSQHTIEFDADYDPTADSPDIWVEDSFVNKYNDERLELDGDTYAVFKTAGLGDSLDWNETHHKFNKPTSTWLIDADSVDYFAEQVEAAGFTFDRTQSDGPDTDGPLFQLADIAAEGDRITVEYWQKNGEGTNIKQGEVASVSTNSGYEDKPQVNFYRDDEQGMYVQFDKFGKESLYTAHSQAPFVGKVKAVTLERETDEDMVPITPTEDTQAIMDAMTAQEQDAAIDEAMRSRFAYTRIDYLREATEDEEESEPQTDGGMTQLALSAIADMEADE